MNYHTKIENTTDMTLTPNQQRQMVKLNNKLDSLEQLADRQNCDIDELLFSFEHANFPLFESNKDLNELGSKRAKILAKGNNELKKSPSKKA
jgi:hypothetical protein